MTNHEWFKSLSAEDLAELLSPTENIIELIRMTCLEASREMSIEDCEKGCAKCWLKWLNKEREESNDKL